MSQLYGGIEAGGTKFVCAVATGPDDVREQIQFPTTEPEETIGRAIDFFKQHHTRASVLSAIGIASFGPVDVNPASKTWGFITATPKPGWSNVDIAGMVAQAMHLPVGFDTDVNAAALGEHRWGAARDLDGFVYFTIGTGIGGGGIIRGRPMHGLIHPEMGHMRLPHDFERDPFPGNCPYHGDCWEGLASGKAIGERWKQPAPELPDDHPAWQMEAHYLGLALNNVICTLSPTRIILGGGVMQKPGLLGQVRHNVQAFLNDYVDSLEIREHIERYIVAPGLGDRAGVMGAIALAQTASA